VLECSVNNTARQPPARIVPARLRPISHPACPPGHSGPSLRDVLRQPLAAV